VHDCLGIQPASAALERCLVQDAAVPAIEFVYELFVLPVQAYASLIHKCPVLPF
jgi:hypothetical protein